MSQPETTRRPQPKSEWGSVACYNPEHQHAIKSWFGGMADNLQGPTQAKILTRTKDNKELKLRALFTRANGEQVELVRTMGRSFTISAVTPTASFWKE